jgi:hypothetical protein
MANTVSILSYANTFGDWMVTTNLLAVQNNNLAANAYTKSTGTLYLNDPSLGLQVANTAIFAGQVQVQGVGSSLYVQNNLTANGQVLLSNPTISLTTYGQANVGGTLLALGANTGLKVSNSAWVGANVTVGGTLDANTITATNLIYTNFLYANSEIVTPTGVLSSYLFTNYLQANTSITTPQVNAGLIDTNQLISYTTASLNTVQANSIQTTTLNVTSESANLITANYASITALTSNNVTTPILNVTTNLNANGATAYVNNLQTIGQLSVGGNFVINGTTVYNSNTFTLNSNSAIGQISSFNVNRGSSGANASIRWNETSKYWDLLDVNNGSNYSQILTANMISIATNSTSTTTLASSSSVNAVFTYAQSAYASANNVGPQVQPAFNTANAANALAQSAYNTANTAASNTVALQTYSNLSNGNIIALQSEVFTLNANVSAVNSLALSAYTEANDASTLASSGYSQANTVASNLTATTTYFQGVENTQNNNIGYTNTMTLSGYNAANGASSLASAAYAQANTATTNAGATNTFAASAYAQANTATTNAGATNTFAASAYNHANNTVQSITGTSNQVTVTGSTTPTLSLPQNIDSYANVQFGSIGVGTATDGSLGDIVAIGNITAYYSDERLKDNLGNIQDALSKVKSLNGFYYQANGIAQALGYPVRREVGVSAQQVQNVLPEIVSPAPIDDKYLTIDYARLVPLLIEAIKELSNQVEELKRAK